MLPRLVSTVFLLTAVLHPVAAAPPPFAVSWWSAGEGVLYRSDGDFTCGPYRFIVYGQHPPFRIDVLQAPFDPTSFEAQVVLTEISLSGGTGNFTWTPDIQDVDVRLRVIDSEQNVADSEARSVRKAKNAEQFMCGCFRNRLWRPAKESVRRGRQRIRQWKLDPEGANAAQAPQPVGAIGAFLPIPLKEAHTHGTNIGQPLERGRVGMLRTSSRAPSYTSSLLPVYEGEDAPRS
ncbi:hypothetical protein JCM11251_004614 [Rhodosporidiobolus azoricus]